jgi:hypothetical protein
MAMYVQQVSVARFLKHFLRMKHLNFFLTIKQEVLGSIHQYYALRGVFEQFIIYSSRLSSAKDGWC